jgi:hypothetical protein
MIANHIHHALQQVHELQARILSGQRFRGYSAAAKGISGVLALCTAIFISAAQPKTERFSLAAWGVLCGVSVLLNYAALARWFFSDPHVRANTTRLAPAWEAVPPLLVGGLLTLVLVQGHQVQWLYGVWMLMMGLANFASRHSMPHSTFQISLFYMAAGTLCLLVPSFAFPNPWPMGIVFFIGETAGALSMVTDPASEEIQHG